MSPPPPPPPPAPPPVSPPPPPAMSPPPPPPPGSGFTGSGLLPPPQPRTRIVASPSSFFIARSLQREHERCPEREAASDVEFAQVVCNISRTGLEIHPDRVGSEEHAAR